MCDPVAAWNTPQLRVLLYQTMAALGFSGVIGPMLIYTARYKLQNTRDAQVVVTAVLLAFMAFDVLHATSVLGVVGVKAVLPGSDMDPHASVNVWVPLAWMGVRTLWLLGVGRDMVRDKGA